MALFIHVSLIVISLIKIIGCIPIEHDKSSHHHHAFNQKRRRDNVVLFNPPVAVVDRLKGTYKYVRSTKTLRETSQDDNMADGLPLNNTSDITGTTRNILDIGNPLPQPHVPNTIIQHFSSANEYSDPKSSTLTGAIAKPADSPVVSQNTLPSGTLSVPVSPSTRSETFKVPSKVSLPNIDQAIYLMHEKAKQIDNALGNVTNIIGFRQHYAEDLTNRLASNLVHMPSQMAQALSYKPAVATSPLVNQTNFIREAKPAQAFPEDAYNRVDSTPEYENAAVRSSITDGSPKYYINIIKNATGYLHSQPTLLKNFYNIGNTYEKVGKEFYTSHSSKGEQHMEGVSRHNVESPVRQSISSPTDDQERHVYPEIQVEGPTTFHLTTTEAPPEGNNTDDSESRHAVTPNLSEITEPVAETVNPYLPKDNEKQTDDQNTTVVSEAQSTEHGMNLTAVPEVQSTEGQSTDDSKNLTAAPEVQNTEDSTNLTSAPEVQNTEDSTNLPPTNPTTSMSTVSATTYNPYVPHDASTGTVDNTSPTTATIDKTGSASPTPTITVSTHEQDAVTPTSDTKNDASTETVDNTSPTTSMIAKTTSASPTTSITASTHEQDTVTPTADTKPQEKPTFNPFIQKEDNGEGAVSDNATSVQAENNEEPASDNATSAQAENDEGSASGNATSTQVISDASVPEKIESGILMDVPSVTDLPHLPNDNNVSIAPAIPQVLTEEENEIKVPVAGPTDKVIAKKPSPVTLNPYLPTDNNAPIEPAIPQVLVEEESLSNEPTGRVPTKKIESVTINPDIINDNSSHVAPAIPEVLIEEERLDNKTTSGPTDKVTTKKLESVTINPYLPNENNATIEQAIPQISVEEEKVNKVPTPGPTGRVVTKKPEAVTVNPYIPENNNTSIAPAIPQVLIEESVSKVPTPGPTGQVLTKKPEVEPIEEEKVNKITTPRPSGRILTKKPDATTINPYLPKDINAPAAQEVPINSSIVVNINQVPTPGPTGNVLTKKPEAMTINPYIPKDNNSPVAPAELHLVTEEEKLRGVPTSRPSSLVVTKKPETVTVNPYLPKDDNVPSVQILPQLPVQEEVNKVPTPGPTSRVVTKKPEVTTVNPYLPKDNNVPVAQAISQIPIAEEKVNGVPTPGPTGGAVTKKPEAVTENPYLPKEDKDMQLQQSKPTLLIITHHPETTNNTLIPQEITTETIINNINASSTTITATSLPTGIPATTTSTSTTTTTTTTTTPDTTTPTTTTPTTTTPTTTTPTTTTTTTTTTPETTTTPTTTTPITTTPTTTTPATTTTTPIPDTTTTITTTTTTTPIPDTTTVPTTTTPPTTTYTTTTPATTTTTTTTTITTPILPETTTTPATTAPTTTIPTTTTPPTTTTIAPIIPDTTTTTTTTTTTVPPSPPMVPLVAIVPQAQAATYQWPVIAYQYPPPPPPPLPTYNPFLPESNNVAAPVDNSNAAPVIPIMPIVPLYQYQAPAAPTNNPYLPTAENCGVSGVSVCNSNGISNVVAIAPVAVQPTDQSTYNPYQVVAPVDNSNTVPIVPIIPFYQYQPQVPSSNPFLPNPDNIGASVSNSNESNVPIKVNNFSTSAVPEDNEVNKNTTNVITPIVLSTQATEPTTSTETTTTATTTATTATTTSIPLVSGSNATITPVNNSAEQTKSHAEDFIQSALIQSLKESYARTTSTPPPFDSLPWTALKLPFQNEASTSLNSVTGNETISSSPYTTAPPLLTTTQPPLNVQNTSVTGNVTIIVPAKAPFINAETTTSPSLKTAQLPLIVQNTSVITNASIFVPAASPFINLQTTVSPQLDTTQPNVQNKLVTANSTISVPAKALYTNTVYLPLKVTQPPLKVQNTSIITNATIFAPAVASLIALGQKAIPLHYTQKQETVTTSTFSPAPNDIPSLLLTLPPKTTNQTTANKVSTPPQLTITAKLIESLPHKTGHISATSNTIRTNSSETIQQIKPKDNGTVIMTIKQITINTSVTHRIVHSTLAPKLQSLVLTKTNPLLPKVLTNPKQVITRPPTDVDIPVYSPAPNVKAKSAAAFGNVTIIQVQQQQTAPVAAAASSNTAGKSEKNNKTLTNCLNDQLIASQPASFDMFRPQCREDGRYKPIQCYVHEKYGKWCWCVDDRGQEIIGSKVDDGSNLSDEKCNNLQKQNKTEEYWTAFYRHAVTTHVPTFGWPTLSPIVMPSSINRVLSQCEKERKLSFSPFLNGDTFSPECNPDGSFKIRQCFTHLYFGKQCWCVDINGQEILGTRRVDGSHPDCHKVTRELCLYPPKNGKCRMNITKVFYNPATDACEPFSYSGCGGNANNFMSSHECESKCKKKSSDVAENTQSVFEEKDNNVRKVDQPAEEKTLVVPANRTITVVPTVSYKRTLFTDNIRNIQFGVIELFEDEMNDKDDPKYKNMTGEMDKTFRKLYKDRYGKMDITSVEARKLPENEKNLKYTTVKVKLFVENSTSSDIARLQDEVNTGRMGELPVIVGSLSSYIPELDKVMLDAAAAAEHKEDMDNEEVTSDETKALLNELFNAGKHGKVTDEGSKQAEGNPEDNPFGLFTSPQSENELAALRSPGDKKGDNENKKITLMLARPLKYYQMGKYDPHIDAGNPALIIPNDKEAGTFKIRKVFPPYSGRFSTQLIPIYNRKGKKIAAVAMESDFHEYQGDTHNKRTNIFHRGYHGNNFTFLSLFSSHIAVYLDFNKYEGAKIMDVSNNSNDGVMYGAATIMHTNYSCGKACSLNGGYILFDAIKFSPKPNTAVSVAMWLKLNSTSGKQSVFSTKGFSHNDAQYHLEVNEGKVKWVHIDETQHVVFYCETTGLQITRNEWFHVLGTYDSGERKAHLYVNGKLLQETKGSGLLSQDWGQKAQIGSNELVGFIDEFYIFTKALSKPELDLLLRVCPSGFHSPKYGLAHHINSSMLNATTEEDLNETEEVINATGGNFNASDGGLRIFLAEIGAVNMTVNITVFNATISSDGEYKDSKIFNNTFTNDSSVLTDNLTTILLHDVLKNMLNVSGNFTHDITNATNLLNGTLSKNPSVSNDSDSGNKTKPTVLPFILATHQVYSKTASIIPTPENGSTDNYHQLEPAFTPEPDGSRVLPTPVTVTGPASPLVISTPDNGIPVMKLREGNNKSLELPPTTSPMVVPTTKATSKLVTPAATGDTDSGNDTGTVIAQLPLNLTVPPIRSCREYFDRCHRRRDGIYRLTTSTNGETESFDAYCDMTRDEGGWTLVVTSKTAGGWTEDNLNDRGGDNPSMQSDFSILGRANAITAIMDDEFEYRLEAGEQGQFGGIWRVPPSYKVLSYFNNQTDIKLQKKFSQWDYSTASIHNRMPYITKGSKKALLTTADSPDQDYFGTIIAKDKSYIPAPWIKGVAENPFYIWYWVREGKGNFSNFASVNSPINIFYYNVEVVNNQTRIILEWTLGSERKSQVLDIHSVTRMVNELRTTVPQPPGVTFKVLRESDRQPLLVNNDDEIELSPSISREEFTVLDIATKKDNNGEDLKTFYFNYQFINTVGSQVDISFNEFGRPEKVTLDADDVLNWLRVFRSRVDPYFLLRASNKSNGVGLKINGQDEYEMKWHSVRNMVDIINISVSGQFIAPLSRYCLNLMVQNSAGTRITVTWRDGIKEIDIDDGAIGNFYYNISSYVTTLPTYNFMMVRYGTNVSELVNNQPVLEITPTQVCGSLTLLGVTSSGNEGSSLENLREDPVCPPAIDGDYSEYSEWTVCSMTCGEGYKTRQRSCNSPSPENGGRSCTDQGLGPSTQTAKCVLPPCITTEGEKIFKKHVIIINLSDNEALISATMWSSSVFEKRIQAGKRMEDTMNVTMVNGTAPRPWLYSATDIEKNNQFLINGKEKYIVPWHLEDIYYVLFVLKKTAGDLAGDSKLYYINIDLYNTAKHTALVQYSEFEDVKEKAVYTKQQTSVEMAIMMTDVPVFTMFAKDSIVRSEYYLNGESTWTVYGSEFKGERNLIDISENASLENSVVRKYYLNLEIINNANTTVMVQFEGGNSPIRIPYRGVSKIREVVNAVKTPLGTVYKVHREGSRSQVLLLNTHEELNIVPTLKDETTRIYITDHETTSELNVYYADLEFINECEERSVSIFWNENDGIVSQDIPTEEMIFRESIITGSEPPSPLYLKGYVKNTNESVMLNGQIVYPVIPKEVARTIQVVIGDAGSAPTTGPMMVYYVSLLVFNNLQEQVSIKWASDDGNFEKFAAANSTTYIESLQVASEQPSNVNFTAFNANGTIMHLNSLPVLDVTPTEDKYLVKVIVGNASQDTEPVNIYYVSLQIDNERSEHTAMLKWVLPDGGVSEKPIPGLSSVGEELQLALVGDPVPIEIRAYDRVTNTSLKINGNYKLHVTPTKEKHMIYLQLEDAVPAASPPPKIYYISVHLNNNERKDVLVTWTEVNENKSEVIPSDGALVQEFVIKSNGNPENVTFMAFHAKDMSTTEINGKGELVVMPTLTKSRVDGEIGHIKAIDQTYYTSIRVINKVDKPVLFLFAGNEKIGEREIPANSIQTADFISSASVAPSNITFSSYLMDGKHQLLLNGRLKLNLIADTSKAVTEVVITDPKGKVFFVNLQVRNEAGKKVTLVWSEDDSPQTRDIENMGVANLTKKIIMQDDLLPLYEFQVHEFGTNRNLLINGQQIFTVTPSDDPESMTYIDITQNDLKGDAGLAEGTRVTETHLVILFDNQLDRMIKIVPSRSSRGKYFVDPRAYLLVNITIDSQDPFQEIVFRAYDQEKQSKVLLNNSEWISIKPTRDENYVNNVTITPPALKVIPSHSYALLEIEDDQIAGNPTLVAHGDIQAVTGGGLNMNGLDTWLDSKFKNSDCLIDPGVCPDGFSISLKLSFFKESLNYTEARYILDSGAHGGSSPGVSMYLKGSKVHYQLTTREKTWTVEHQVDDDEEKWYYILATWREPSGLSLYYNAMLVAADNSGTKIKGSAQNELNPNFSIGRNIRGEAYAAMKISSFTTFNTYIEVTEVSNVYLFFWSSYTAKAYYARVRIYNDVGRDALLLPDKGKPDGFTIHSGRPLEITLIDLSTDGKSVAPVFFNASDLETGMSFLINNSPKPYQITPTESQVEYTDLILTSPAPAVNPSYIWLTNTIRNNQVPANPPILVNGTVGVVNGGLFMDGATGSLDAGEFNGDCFSNPILCDQGLTIASKLMLDDMIKVYGNPKFVIDSGGHRGQGFSIYLQNNQIYAEVAFNNKMWRVKSSVPTNRWIFLIITWAKEKGLHMYINGEAMAKTTDTIEVQFHNNAKNTKISIGRENTGKPDTMARMTTNIFILFDQYVTKTEATKVYVYYWGHSTTISTDRFININFENKAGEEITLYPDKGEHRLTGYSIKQRMILELRLVEQGAQTNFPVTFRAKSANTGESLPLDGEQTYVSTPSELSTQVFIVDITRPLSCQEENGVFPDPGDHYYFVSCSQGIAQRKKCPTGTIYSKDNKECIKEKDADKKTATKISAQVKFQNLAGKEITITAKPAIESIVKEIELKPGSRATLKIDESSMNEPVIFSAHWTGEEKALLLNGNYTYKVKPKPDANYTVEIAITDSEFYYTAATYTASGPEAGTASRVFLKLIGIYGQTNEIQLVGNDESVFKGGETNVFKITAGNLGPLQKIIIRNDDSGDSSDWHLDKVVVNDTSGTSYKFPANVWLSHDPGNQLEMAFDLNTGAADKYGASSGAQQVNTAKLDVINSLFRKVDLKVSTLEKPFHLKEEYDGQLTITTPNNAAVNMTAVDADTGDRYYINGELVYKVPVKAVGVIEKIYIGDSANVPGGSSDVKTSSTTNAIPITTGEAKNGAKPNVNSTDVANALPGKTEEKAGGIQIQFTVINKAGRNVTISDKTGTWKMDFPVENEENQPQVALTFNKEKALQFNASVKDGKEQLFLNGEKVFVLDPSSAATFKGFVVHKKGFDWKPYLSIGSFGETIRKFSYVAINQASQDVTLSEVSGTTSKSVILKAGILQGGQSLVGITEALRYHAVGKNGKQLQINGQDQYKVGEPESGEMTNFIIHNREDDWKKYAMDGNLAMATGSSYMFIVPNIIESDVTVTETTGTELSIDIEKGDMAQFTIPMSTHGNKAFKFEAFEKDNNEDVLMNNQKELIVDPNDAITLMPIVVHKEGQPWEKVQSSFLGSGTASPMTVLKLIFSNGKGDEDIVIKEESGNFKELVVPKGAVMMTVNLKIPERIQRLNLTSHTALTKTNIRLNGENYLLVDPRAPPSLIIVHKKGVDWRKEKNFIQKNGNPLYGGEYFDGQQNTFQIHVRNDVDESIKFREVAPAIGPVVVVPKDVTAKVDYIDKDRTGKLTFEAVGEDTTSGLETKFLLNGLPEFVVDEQYLSPEGEFVVVHRNGHGWEEILQEMKIKMLRAKSNLNPINNVGFGSTVDNRLSGIPMDKVRLTSNDSTTSASSKVESSVAKDEITSNNSTISSVTGTHSAKMKNNTDSNSHLNESSSPHPTNTSKDAKNSSTASAEKKSESTLPILSGNINMTVDGNKTAKSEIKDALSYKLNTNNITATTGNTSSIGNANTTSSRTNSDKVTTDASEAKSTVSSDSPSILEKSGKIVGLDAANTADNNVVINNTVADSKVSHVSENSSKSLSSDAVGIVGSVGGTDGVTTIGNSSAVHRNVISANDTKKILELNNSSESTGKLKETENLIKPLNGEVNHYFLPYNASMDRNGTNATGDTLSNDTIFSGKANMIHNLDFGNSFIISLANLANEDATLIEGNSQTIYIPSKAAVSATLRGNGSFVFSAETKNGKSLKIDGEVKKTVKDAEMPATLIIHEDGQDWQNEYKAMKSVDGTEEVGGSNITNMDNATMNTKSLLIFNNASVKASVEFVGTNILVEVPAGDIENIPVVTLPSLNPYRIKTNTKDFDGKDLMINGQEEVSINAEDIANTLVIHRAGILAPYIEVPQGDLHTTRYGKLNFKNQAGKEVKIYEVSGIGEPTILSKDYISTFYVKSPKLTAMFKAEDATTKDGYLLNGKDTYEIHLSTNPHVETDVLITKPDAAGKRGHDSANQICDDPIDTGPCFSALQYETQVEAAEGKSEPCKTYLGELLNKCSWRNTSFSEADCPKNCNANDSEVCSRVWNPRKCSSTITRYSYSQATKCKAIDFGGCLGNNNNFATPQECSNACISDLNDKRIVRSYEERMKNFEKLDGLDALDGLEGFPTSLLVKV